MRREINADRFRLGDLMTLKEAAERLDVSYRRALQLTEDGSLSVVVLAKNDFRVLRSEVEVLKGEREAPTPTLDEALTRLGPAGYSLSRSDLMAALRKSGYSLALIGSWYGLSRSRVWAILERRKRDKHIVRPGQLEQELRQGIKSIDAEHFSRSNLARALGQDYLDPMQSIVLDDMLERGDLSTSFEEAEDGTTHILYHKKG